LGDLDGRLENERRRSMCLAVPGRLLDLSGEDPLTRVGRVDFGGVVKEINLAFAPEARVGDHLLVHVGFAIAVIDEAEAGRVFAHLREIGELAPPDPTRTASP
jgi:hydrogenase expression/formation protein HypC